MLRLIILLAFVVNLNVVSTETSTQDTSDASLDTANWIVSGKSTKCKTNEEYSNCPNQVCRAKTCNDVGIPLKCYQENHTECGKPSCICKDGFVKNSKGICIPKRNCPSCGGDPNAWSGCGNFCNRCRKNVPCPKICRLNACDCKPGYVYDETKQKCVSPIQCPEAQCKVNEEYSYCPNSVCREKTCDDLGFPLPCLEANTNSTECGRPSCICKEGYVRNKIGLCIPKRDCPSCGGDSNARSGCGTFCNRCTKNAPCSDICRPNSCDCRAGYVYDETKKKCVLPSQCPIICKKNEEYAECPNRVCREKTCTELGYPLTCLQLDITVECGEPGCICQTGFVRNKNGVCIPSRECPSCGGDPNAWSGCGTFCTRCSNYKSKTRVCLLFCRLNGCDCRDGYVYDGIKKKCVLPEQCPCGPNEVPSDCANTECVIEYCTQKDLNIKCKPDCTKCKRGCLCAKGYLRAENGVCIPRDQCPPKCGRYEVYSSCANAGCDKRNCSQVAEPALCIDVLEGGCIGGCVCQSGYLRNAAGNCVPIAECPSKEICPKPHEYYDQCPPSCPARQCGIDDRLILCEPTDKCNEPSCRCEEGYYRNPSGDCVTLEECPKCGPLEVYSDCSNAGCEKRNCSQVAQPALCIDVTQGGCIGGCVCQSGYLRTAAGQCVPTSECPSKEICPKPHEYYDQCPPSCPARQCGIDDRLVRCAPPSPTAGCNRPSCRCDEGYYRNSYDECVTFDECPKCSVNEVYDPCPSSCPPRTCKTKDRVYKCAAPLQPGDPLCPRPTCRCADGYYRNNDGKCVSKEECPPQCGPNEVNSNCGNDACIPDCSQPDRGSYCKWDPINCKPGCVCADGYIRDQNGVCVPKDKCPPNKPTCSENEEYTDCPNKVCLPKRCDELGFPVPCYNSDRNTTNCGDPGCICKSYFVRNKNGVCVDPAECPSCGGDRNAQRGCGSFCVRCSNYKDPNRKCPISCILNGCQCRPNYIYDEVSKKCVLPEKCPK